MSDLAALLTRSLHRPLLVLRRRCGPRRGLAAALAFAAAATFQLASDSSAAGCVDYGEYLHPMGVLETPVGLGFCAVSGTHAYVTDWEQTFHVIDVSDPDNPRLVGSLDGGRRLWDVAAQGAYAYVTTWDGASLSVIDVSVPEAPRIAGSLNLPGASYGVAVSGSYAYVACGDLQVIDISDPPHPRIVGGLGTPSMAAGIAISGNLAYVADWDDGLLVADISDPLHPHLLGSVDTPQAAWVVAVSGTVACVGEYDSGYGTGGLNVIDVSDPHNPRLVHRIDSLETIYSASIHGRIACITSARTDHAGMLVLDLTNPENPSIVDTFAFPYYYPIGVAFAPVPSAGGPLVYLSGAISYDPLGSEGWFQTVDISSLRHPEELGSLRLPCCGGSIAAAGTHAYVAGGSSGFQVIDIADPHNPAIAGSVDTPDYAEDVAVDEKYAYVADNHSGLQVIDIMNPQAPRIVGNAAMDGAGAVAVSGGFAYVANGSFGLQVCDVSNPDRPVIVGTADTPDFAADVAVSGSFAYVADWRSGLQVIDVSNPADPRVVGALHTPTYADNVAVSGKHAYLVTSWPDLQFYVIDVVDPRNPRIAGKMSIMDWGGMVVSGHHVYLANFTMGVQMIDVSNPERPHATGFIGTGVNVWGVAVSGSLAFVVDEVGCHDPVSTFRIFPSQCEPTVTPKAEDSVSLSRLRVTLSPNPTTSRAAIRLSRPVPGPVRAMVWDVTGRLVRTLCDGVLPARAQEIPWDGRDNDGRSVAAGIYWVRVATAEGSTTERLVVLR